MSRKCETRRADSDPGSWSQSLSIVLEPALLGNSIDSACYYYRETRIYLAHSSNIVCNSSNIMHFARYVVLITITSIAHLTHGFPTSSKPCAALIETSPWYVSDMLVWKTLPNASISSLIHFHLSDVNFGLALETSCGGAIPVEIGSRPGQAQGWIPCEDTRVRFLYRTGNLQVQRSYLDEW